LSIRDLRYRGLNLTARTLNGVLKYPWLYGEGPPHKTDKWGAYESERREFEWVRAVSVGREQSIEAALMDWADDVTYAVHDLEDFYRVGLIPLDRIAGADERTRFYESFFVGSKRPGKLRDRFSDFTVSEIDDALEFLFEQALVDVPSYRGTRVERAWIREQTSFLIDWFMRAVRLERNRVVIERRRLAEVAVLKEMAWFYIIESPALATLQYGQRQVIRELHALYIRAATESKLRSLFPSAQRELLQRADTKSDPRRVATDFVASLTEDMAFELHHRLTGVSRGSLLDAAALASR
jgi:dGTPase